jgi:hypothetical protein
MSHFTSLADCVLLRFAGLPPGIRQSDCDGPTDEPSDLDGDRLWAACSDSLQERIAMQFARTRADDVRDAVLDAEGLDGQAAPALPQSMGTALWRAWIDYRDHVLNQLHRRGQVDLR